MPFAHVWCPGKGCDTVKVSGAEASRPQEMGTFTPLSGVTHFSRSVYRNWAFQASYLFYSGGSWRIGPDYKTTQAGIVSPNNRNELDPTRVPGTWAEWKGSWQPNTAIKVECVQQQGDLRARPRCLAWPLLASVLHARERLRDSQTLAFPTEPDTCLACSFYVLFASASAIGQKRS